MQAAEGASWFETRRLRGAPHHEEKGRAGPRHSRACPLPHPLAIFRRATTDRHALSAHARKALPPRRYRHHRDHLGARLRAALTAHKTKSPALSRAFASFSWRRYARGTRAFHPHSANSFSTLLQSRLGLAAGAQPRTPCSWNAATGVRKVSALALPVVSRGLGAACLWVAGGAGEVACRSSVRRPRRGRDQGRGRKGGGEDDAVTLLHVACLRFVSVPSCALASHIIAAHKWRPLHIKLSCNSLML